MPAPITSTTDRPNPRSHPQMTRSVGKTAVVPMGSAGVAIDNRQIAQSLFVTTNAVAYHLRHVDEKLEIDRRGQTIEALADGQARRRALLPLNCSRTPAF
jgi:DNA-binding NarL/FixJ family response regulator